VEKEKGVPEASGERVRGKTNWLNFNQKLFLCEYYTMCLCAFHEGSLSESGSVACFLAFLKKSFDIMADRLTN